MQEELNLDKPTLVRISELYPDVAERLVNVYAHVFYKTKLTMRCTEALRSFERQEKLYAQGRTAPGKIVTNAMSGESIHHYGLAADSCFLGNDPYLERTKDGALIWQEFGNSCQMWGLQWGGHFPKPDQPHVQVRYGLLVSDMKTTYEKSGIKGLWYRIDQIRKAEPRCVFN